MTRFDFVFDSTTPAFCSVFSPSLSSPVYLCIKRDYYYSFNFCRYFNGKEELFYSFCII